MMLDNNQGLLGGGGGQGRGSAQASETASFHWFSIKLISDWFFWGWRQGRQTPEPSRPTIVPSAILESRQDKTPNQQVQSTANTSILIDRSFMREHLVSLCSWLRAACQIW